MKFSEARIGGSYYEQLIAQLKDLLQSYQTSYKPNSVARLVLLMTNEAIHTKSSHPNAIYSRTKDLVEYQNRNLRGTDLHVALIDVDRLKDYPEIELRELLRLP